MRFIPKAYHQSIIMEKNWIRSQEKLRHFINTIATPQAVDIGFSTKKNTAFIFTQDLTQSVIDQLKEAFTKLGIPTRAASNKTPGLGIINFTNAAAKLPNSPCKSCIPPSLESMSYKMMNVMESLPGGGSMRSMLQGTTGASPTGNMPSMSTMLASLGAFSSGDGVDLAPPDMKNAQECCIS